MRQLFFCPDEGTEGKSRRWRYGGRSAIADGRLLTAVLLVKADAGRWDFFKAAVKKSKTGAEAPVFDCSAYVYQALSFCFLRRAITPSSPSPASIIA